MIRRKNLDFFSLEFLRFLIFRRGWELALVVHVRCRLSDAFCPLS